MEGIEKNAGKKFEKSYFDVLGLCCSSEVPMVEKILNSLDGIKDFSVVIPTKTLIVVHDSLLISQIQIVKALNESRLEASVRVYGHGSSYKNKWPSPYAVACGALLALHFFKYVYSPFRWLAVVAIVVGIPPVILKAVAAVRNCRLDINILVLITVSGSVALRDYWEAATIVFLFTISEWLELRASHKATAVMSSLVSVVPQKAVIAETGEEVNADQVKMGTVVAVKAGHVIPIDGVVVDGSCDVDEKIMTGESFPVTKQKDSTVWGSTINLNGYISIKTTAVAEDCVVARMAKIVEEAQNKKSGTQRFLDKCAKYYTPAIVLVSASLAIVPLAFHVDNKREWYHLALVVLVSGCPCALLLSTPVAMYCALSKAATLGVLFKGAQHLETLARIKMMAFDKTGTITRGEFQVVDFKPLRPDISLDALLYWISSIESKSSHPMAAAVVEFATTHSIEPKPDRVEHFQNFPGEGISGKIEDNELYVGNRRIASRAGCSEVPKLQGYDTQGKSVGYVFLGSSPVAVFCLSDVCRTGAKEAIEELKSLGIKTIMLTGDCQGAAKRAQEQLGGSLEVIRAELLPEDKASIIKEFQKEGPTAMIGDGLNDAPALATADIGISMGISGSALATESGDVVLMTNDIQRVPKALHIAKRVRRKIIENVILSISTKAAIIGLAIAGHPLVWAAVLSDVGTCLLVIGNSMLLLRGTSTKSCNSTSHSHIHKQPKSSCCDDKSQKLQPCSSNKCASSGSTKEHDHNAHSHPCSGDRVKDHGCCDKADHHDLESQNQHNHGDSCGTKKCSSSIKEHAHNARSGDRIKDHECCDKVDHHDLESQKQHSHSGTKKCPSSTNEHAHNAHGGDKIKDHECCDKVDHHDSEPQHSHCGTKKCSSSMKEHALIAVCHPESEDRVDDHQHNLQMDHKHACSSAGGENQHNCNTASNKHCLESHCVHHKDKSEDDDREHCKESCKSAGTVGCEDSTTGCNGPSKKVHRGCCDSYRRECCIRSGHFETNFRGGLSEIVID
ncbi:putative inactive cadmium/zinc-transporting ATPase HMA3 isoform X2 [Salvia miltiorrhiza]|nr:putative inactive cadmium/zinc-transporting ATPase HMA3 isoform X2 [Salvia miltiorrhiza]XP_057806486.1 putative inactive cadmium/zinc-transporting ATPase HMA3 isoform X2 [Salvia miltiorrhiza]XP_057806487.1 putative inactive cadmium/zinc-transporting ATPase HMA3 isoform X2 [Salvia miltiorrhiza]